MYYRQEVDMFPIVVLTMIILGVGYFLYKFIPRILEKIEKKINDKEKPLNLENMEVLERISIFKSFMIFIKGVLYFIFPNKKTFHFIDKGIAVPLSDMFGENGESNSTQSLNKLFHKYLNHLYTNKTNSVDTNMIMDFEGLGNILSSFRKKEIFFISIVVMIYLVVFIFGILNLMGALFSVLILAMYKINLTVIMAGVGAAISLAAIVNAIHMLITVLFNGFKSINFVNQKRLFEFVDLKLGYTVLKAQEIYGDIANEAYSSVIQTLVSTKSQKEYFSEVDNLKKIANEAVLKIENKGFKHDESRKD